MTNPEVLIDVESAPAARWLTIIGLGEDGVEGLSGAAKRAISEADIVFGGQRHLDLAVSLIRGETQPWASPIENSFPQIAARRGTSVVILASGDPFWFGVGATLSHHFDPTEMQVLPQSSALSLASARMGWPLQSTTCVSLCGRPLATLRPHVREGVRLLVLSADASTPAAVAGLLVGIGFGESRMHVLEALGGPNECQRTASAHDFALTDIQPLNLIAIEPVADEGARSMPLVPGRPDDWFDNDGQITKAEIRAMTLASLDPQPGLMLWDIGSGSGSIGLEWLLACPDAEAIAVDRRADRLACTIANAETLGVPRLRTVEGAAPEIFTALPDPDVIFLGGGAGNPAVMQAAWARLPSGGRLVANAVTLETQTRLHEAFKAHGGTLTRIAIERAEPVGTMTGMRPAMPVLHYAVEKP